MANDCLYEMKIKGSKSAIKRVVDCLKADYNYYEGKPTHKHFFRIFDYYDEDDLQKNDDGTYTKYLWGYCAWSVKSCMLEGGYYSGCKTAHEDIFMGTTLEEQSKDCEIEVFSEEPGCCFSEHYLYKNGKCLIDSCIDIEEGGYNDNGEPTTDIDWDNYEGDIVTFNDNRESLEGGFRFTL